MASVGGFATSGGGGATVGSPSSREKILSFTEGNEAFARQIVGEFIRITPPLLEDMKKALAGNDLNSLKGYCHRLKGNLAYLGEDRVMKIVMEIDCNTVTFGELRPFFSEMDNMLERFAKEWDLPSPLSLGVSHSD